jgi:hypothetical protein
MEIINIIILFIVFLFDILVLENYNTKKIIAILNIRECTFVLIYYTSYLQEKGGDYFRCNLRGPSPYFLPFLSLL